MNWKAREKILSVNGRCECGSSDKDHYGHRYTAMAWRNDDNDEVHAVHVFHNRLRKDLGMAIVKWVPLSQRPKTEGAI